MLCCAVLCFSTLSQARKLPKCPRAAECRFTLDEEAVRAVLGGRSDLEDQLVVWHDLRLLVRLDRVS